MRHSALVLFAQRTRIPTSARSIGFCVIWVCISSSSSSVMAPRGLYRKAPQSAWAKYTDFSEPPPEGGLDLVTNRQAFWIAVYGPYRFTQRYKVARNVSLLPLFAARIGFVAVFSLEVLKEYAFDFFCASHLILALWGQCQKEG